MGLANIELQSETQNDRIQPNIANQTNISKNEELIRFQLDTMFKRPLGHFVGGPRPHGGRTLDYTKPRQTIQSPNRLYKALKR